MGNLLHAFVHDWPRWLRIAAPIGFFLFCAAFFSVLFFVLRYDVDLKNLKFTHPETDKARNCRVVAQSFEGYYQNTNSRILAYDARMSNLDRDFDDKRQKCLAELAQLPPGPVSKQSGGGCGTPSHGWVTEYGFSGTSGRYRQVLQEIAIAQENIQSRITALEKQEDQERQRLRQICFESEALQQQPAPTATENPSSRQVQP